MRDYSFGNFLRELRERRGLSQYQLGMLTGVSNKAVSKWENGSARPQSRILYRLSEVLGVTVDELLACRYDSAEGIDRKEMVMRKKEIWDKVYTAMKERYGNVLPVELSNRYFTEYEERKNGEEILHFDLLGQINKTAENTGEHMRITGGIGASLAAYMLGATEVNPLRPHYYCPICRKIRFAEGVLCGWDLPEEQCSCGREYQRDGHNLPCETLGSVFRGAYHYDVFLSRNLYRSAEELIFAYFKDNPVIVLNKGDNPDIKTFVIPDGRMPVCTEPEVAEYIRRKHFGKAVEHRVNEALSFEKYYDRLKSFPMITLIISQELEQYGYLEKITNIPFGNVSYGDRSVLEAFLNGAIHKTEKIQYRKGQETCCPETGFSEGGEGHLQERKAVENGTEGIPDFESEFVRNMLKDTLPDSFYELIQIPGLAHGTGVWQENGQQLVKEGIRVGDIIAYRDDVFHYVQKRIEEKGGRGTGYACRIMEEARRGVYAGGKIPEEIRQQLFALGAEEWFVESLGRIRYLFPRAQGVLSVKYALILMWYKIHYPEEFRAYLSKAYKEFPKYF